MRTSTDACPDLSKYDAPAGRDGSRRDLIGTPIAITSGYRSKEINKLVGGVPNSQHCLGEAADCYVVQGPEYLLSVLVKSGLAYDQAIVYKRKRFLHLSYRENCNRMMVLRK